MGRKPWDQGMSRKHILDAIEGRCAGWGPTMSTSTSCTAIDPPTPIDEALEALDTVVQCGKARYVGVSNWLAYRVARALGRGELKNWRASTASSRATTCCSAPSSATCCRYARRKASRSSRTTRSPAACSPASTATPNRRRRAPASRSAAGARYQARYWHEREFETVEALRAVANEAGMSMTTMAVALGAGQPGHHRADHRRQPSRAARRQPRGSGRAPLPARPQGQAGRDHPWLARGRRRSLKRSAPRSAGACRPGRHW